MKTIIHKYRGQRVNGIQVKISDLIKLNPKDQIIFDKYITDVSGSAGEKRSKKITRELLVIHDTAQVGLDEWTYDILSQFLEVLNKTEMAKYTKNDYKKNLKAFLKFQYDDWYIRFKELKHKGLKQVDPVNRKKINKQTLLKSNEFELLVRGCDKPLMRVYVHLAYKSAGRPEELLKLKFKHINLDTGELNLYSSKTDKPRDIFVDDECKNDILNYKENQYSYPAPNKEDYIFVSPVKRSVPITTPTLYSNLKTVSKRTIQREDITPYLFRHTRLSYLIRILSPKIYEKFAGHSLEVGMKFYAHVDVDDVKEELYAKVFDKKEMPLEKENKIKREMKAMQERFEQKFAAMEVLMGLNKNISEVKNDLSKVKEYSKEVEEKAKKH